MRTRNIQHTRTPWKVDGSGALTRITHNEQNIATIRLQSDAELIVRAVNSHSSLVATLHNVLNHNKALKEPYQLSPSLVREIEIVIAKAEKSL